MLTEKISTYSNECSFKTPASKKLIEESEQALKINFPELLTKLLLESNGVYGECGLRLLWTVEEIVATNIEFRGSKDFKELYMPFDNLLFFGDAGNGDQFAFSIVNGKISREDIFVWNHEDDSRQWVAPNLLKYFEWWLSGELKI